MVEGKVTMDAGPETRTGTDWRRSVAGRPNDLFRIGAGTFWKNAGLLARSAWTSPCHGDDALTVQP